MYEHFRNDVLSGLMPFFTRDQLNRIGTVIDSAAANYTISEKETALAIYNDEIYKIVNLYLASKKLEGLSELTIENYANRLRKFFNDVNISPKDVTTNIIRMFLVTYQQRENISDRTLDKFRQILNSFFCLVCQRRVHRKESL